MINVTPLTPCANDIQMRAAVTNIALPAFDHIHYFSHLRELGIDGIEVATSRIWPDPLAEVDSKDIFQYRAAIEHAGLEVVGLHSLLYQVPNCVLFGSDTEFNNLVSYFELLISVCAELGGRTLVFGAGRKRGKMPYAMALSRTAAFIGAISPSLHENKVELCFEPLGPKDTDFINLVSESLELVNLIDSDNLGLQLDVKAIIENKEVDQLDARQIRGKLTHVHVNTPGLGIIQASDRYTTSHIKISRVLQELEYDGFLTIEQLQMDDCDILNPIESSLHTLHKIYMGN